MTSKGKASEELWEVLMKRHHGEKNVFIHRNTDLSDVKDAWKKQIIIPPVPADYTVTDRGIMFYAEIKSTSNLTSWAFDFRPAQWAGMKKQLAAKGEYFIFVHSLADDRWYKVPAEDLLQWVDAGRKSMKWGELEDYQTIWSKLR